MILNDINVRSSRSTDPISVLRYSFRVGHRGKYNGPVSCPVLALIISISRTDRRLSLERLFHITRAVRPHSDPRSRSRGKTCDKGTNKRIASDASKREISNDFLVNAFRVAIAVLGNPWHRNRKSLRFECSFNVAGHAFYCYDPCDYYKRITWHFKETWNSFTVNIF